MQQVNQVRVNLYLYCLVSTLHTFVYLWDMSSTLLNKHPVLVLDFVIPTLCHMISSFALLIISTATRGRRLTINVNMGDSYLHKNLYSCSFGGVRLMYYSPNA